MNTLVSIKVKILELINWSYWPPQIMLTVEPRRANKTRTCSPLSFKDMSFGRPYYIHTLTHTTEI